METGKAMFVVQGFFELFETLLSYFSNTISFIRIGAFAVSHAAIMEVVLHVGGSRERKSELGRRDLRKPVRLRIRRSDRRNPGAASGILRTVQPFL